MTVADLAPSVEYLEDGVSLTFPVPFRFLNPADLAVARLLPDGAVAPLTYGTQWTATGGGTDAGGTLTLAASVAGAHLFIRRSTARAQQIDYHTLDIFPAETHESGLDRAMLIDQEQDVRLLDLEDRAVLLPPGESGMVLPPADERAGQYWAWDADGELIASTGTGNDPNLRMDLAQWNGSELVGWKYPAYTGAPSSIDSVIDAALLTDIGAASLQEAINAAATAGRALHITRAWEFATPAAPADLTAAVTAPANSKLVGRGGSIRILSGNANGILVAGDNVTIRDLPIYGPGLTGTGSPLLNNGVLAGNVNNLVIENNLVTGWSFCGIFFAGARNLSIHRNWLHSNTGSASNSDITGYSAPGSGERVTIAGNFCLSNNSQGIACSQLGGDGKMIVSGNMCAATDAGLADTAAGALVRRHGILISYNGAAIGGEVTVTGNICHNTKWTGIYSANGGGNGITPGIVITGNVCSQNGHAADASGGLQGGIYLNGGNSTTIIANNAIYDFRGDPSIAAMSGGIVINSTLPAVVDAAAPRFPRTSVHGNTLDKSSSRGIVLKGLRCRGVDVARNTIGGSAREDIYVLNTPAETVNVGGHFIERNICDRSGAAGNDDYPSIYVECQSGTNCIHITGNKLRGQNSTIDSAQNANAGILINAASNVQPFAIEDNVVRGYFKAIAFNSYLVAATRHTQHRIRNNHIFDCTTGYILVSSASSATTVIELGIMSNVINFTAAGAQSGAQVARAGRAETYYDNQATPVAQVRLVATGLYAAPTTGTWAQGDRAENVAPAAAGAPAWSCVVAGTPGTWKAWANLAA